MPSSPSKASSPSPADKNAVLPTDASGLDLPTGNYPIIIDHSPHGPQGQMVWHVHWWSYGDEWNTWEDAPHLEDGGEYPAIWKYHHDNNIPLPRRSPRLPHPPASYNYNDIWTPSEEEMRLEPLLIAKRRDLGNKGGDVAEVIDLTVDEVEEPKEVDSLDKGKKRMRDVDEALDKHNNKLSLQETPIVPNTSTRLHNRHRRQVLSKHNHAAANQSQTLSQLANALPQIIGLDTGFGTTTPIQVLYRKLNPSHLDTARHFQKLNLSNPRGFMSLSEVKAGMTDIIELHDGYNILIDCDTFEIFGLIYYRSLNDLSSLEQERVLDVMAVVDLVTRTTNNIVKTNGASHANKDNASPHGIMCEFGWRASYEAGGTIGKYVNRRTKEGEANMPLLKERMPMVANFYNHRLNILSAVAAAQVKNHAIAHSIPQYDKDTIDPSPTNKGYNMFSATRGGFCNTSHKDNDTSPFNFGLFFLGAVKEGKFARKLPRVGKQLKGGEFMWTEYGVVVGHAAAGSWAEVMWRGDKDHHCTLSCWSETGPKVFEEVDRYGLSIQITAKAQSRINILRQRGDPRVV